MHLILLFISIIVLFPFPILYPPIASFTAYFFAKDDQLDAVSLFLLYSSAIITSLIAATITPIADTAIYLKSFQSIGSFDFRYLALDNDGLEPLYKVYELILSIFIGDNSNLFLLTTALIINFLATTAILRIGIQLNQYRLPCLILAVCYSLVAPALGMPLFLLRSSLSLAILFLGISFYNDSFLLFCLLGLISAFIHLSSSMIFGLVFFHKYWVVFGRKISQLSESFFFTLIDSFSKTFFLIFIAALLTTLIAPGSTASILSIYLANFASSGNVASDKAKALLDAEHGDSINSIDITNPVFIIQVLVSILCFLTVQNDFDKNHSKSLKHLELLSALRLVGKFLITLIVLSAPQGLLTYRLGFFNFMYFPLWLINIPFTVIRKQINNYSKYLVLFSLASVLAYSLYWMPKRESVDAAVVVLDNKPLQSNLVQVIEYFFK
jgi:hypothetical protein